MKSRYNLQSSLQRREFLKLAGLAGSSVLLTSCGVHPSTVSTPTTAPESPTPTTVIVAETPTAAPILGDNLENPPTPDSYITSWTQESLDHLVSTTNTIPEGFQNNQDIQNEITKMQDALNAKKASYAHLDILVGKVILNDKDTLRWGLVPVDSQENVTAWLRVNGQYTDRPLWKPGGFDPFKESFDFSIPPTLQPGNYFIAKAQGSHIYLVEVNSEGNSVRFFDALHQTMNFPTRSEIVTQQAPEIDAYTKRYLPLAYDVSQDAHGVWWILDKEGKTLAVSHPNYSGLWIGTVHVDGLKDVTEHTKTELGMIYPVYRRNPEKTGQEEVNFRIFHKVRQHYPQTKNV